MKGVFNIIRLVLDFISLIIIVSVLVLYMKGYRPVNTNNATVDWIAFNALRDLIVPFIVVFISTGGMILVNNDLIKRQTFTKDIERYLDKAIDNVFEVDNDNSLILVEEKKLIDEIKNLAQKHNLNFSNKKIKKALVIINSPKIELNYESRSIRRLFKTEYEKESEKDEVLKTYGYVFDAETYDRR